MWISRYFTYFAIFSCMGWIYETLYCTIKTGKWDNRGFLYGPVCPIYGVGGVAITALTDVVAANVGNAENASFTWWQVFLVSFFGSIVLEYTTSFLLEKLFHAYWWDYSSLPLNIHGRVCLPCSIGFGLAGLLVVYVIAPWTKEVTGWITPLGYEVLSLVFMCLYAIDTTLTVSALTHFEKVVIAAEDALNQYMDNVVDTIEEKKHETIGGKEWMTRSLSSMGFASKAAIRRVQGFKKTNRIGQKRSEFGLEFLRSHRK